jgi:uncharacterized protein YjiS (DUF1127 family)
MRADAVKAHCATVAGRAGTLGFLQSRCRRLVSLLTHRPALISPECLGAHALKDIGLSGADHMAIRAGTFYHDATRRQR